MVGFWLGKVYNNIWFSLGSSNPDVELTGFVLFYELLLLEEEKGKPEGWLLFPEFITEVGWTFDLMKLGSALLEMLGLVCFVAWAPLAWFVWF